MSRHDYLVRPSCASHGGSASRRGSSSAPDINANPPPNDGGDDSSSSFLSESCRRQLGLREEEVAAAGEDLGGAIERFDRELRER